MLGRAIFLKPPHAKYGLRFCASNSKSSDTSMISPTNVEPRWKRYRRLIVEDKDFIQTLMALCTTAGVLVTAGYMFARSFGASYERMKDIETNAKLIQKDFEVALALSKAELERAELKRKLVEDGVESAIFKARLELISGMFGIVAISLLLFQR